MKPKRQAVLLIYKYMCDIYIYIHILYGGFLKSWYPTSMGVPTKNDQFWGVKWGYDNFRKHPYGVMGLLSTSRTSQYSSINVVYCWKTTQKHLHYPQWVSWCIPVTTIASGSPVGSCNPVFTMTALGSSKADKCLMMTSMSSMPCLEDDPMTDVSG